MASTAISYGTEVWLAELKRDGWTLTVDEHVPLGWSGRLDQTVFDTSNLGLERQVGVLATDEHGAGVFVPCPDRDAAWKLLQAVEDEVAGLD